MLNLFKLNWVNPCGTAVLPRMFTFHPWLQHCRSLLGSGISQAGIQHHAASVQSLIHLLSLYTCSVYLLYCESDLSSKSNMPASIWLLCMQWLSVLHVCTCSDIITCMKTYRCSWPISRHVNYNDIAQELWRDPEEKIWENGIWFKASFPCLNSVESH